MPHSIPPELLRACEDLLDGAITQRSVRCISLWSRQGDDKLILVGARPIREPFPATLRLEADDAQWLAASQGAWWRIEQQSVAGFRPSGSDCIYLVYAIGGRLLAELCIAGDFDLTPEDIDVIGQSLGSLLDVLGVKSQAPITQTLEFVDLSLVDSVALGDRAFVRELLSIAVVELSDGWREVLVLIRDGRLDDVSALAHRLRSTARALGAIRLDEVLNDLETASANRSMPDTQQRAGVAAPIVDATRSEIELVLDHGT